MIYNFKKFLESKQNTTITLDDIRELSENFEYYIADDNDSEVEFEVSKEEFVEFGSHNDTERFNIDIQDNKVIGRILQKKI